MMETLYDSVVSFSFSFLPWELTWPYLLFSINGFWSLGIG